jgi:hypothetical protein
MGNIIIIVVYQGNRMKIMQGQGTPPVCVARGGDQPSGFDAALVFHWIQSNRKPFVWKASADVILDKVRRCKEINGY